MIRKHSKLGESLLRGRALAISLKITPSLLTKFVALTEDKSSIHTDELFGQKALYGKNIAHGMLPLLFISALPSCQNTGYRCSVQNLSANFLKPIFKNDWVLLESSLVDFDDKQNKGNFEYVLKNKSNNKIYTTGYYLLEFKKFSSNNALTQENTNYDSQASLLQKTLVEQDLQFNQINKGVEKSFCFRVTKDHAYVLYEILTEGLNSGRNFKFSQWNDQCDTANLLAVSLYSTIVGMCLPGKYGILKSFVASFEKKIQWNSEYAIKGKIGFKSLSTLTLLEDISIFLAKEKTKLFGTGEINILFNEPSISMPSLKSLKEKDADLQLKNKVVLITGASRGIGETTAKMFSLYGARVVINYFRSEEEANNIANEINDSGGEAMILKADVSDRQEVARMVSEVHKNYGGINILVNNAVSGYYAVPFKELSWEEIEKDIDVIIKGSFNCCQEVLPYMALDNYGKIINVSTLYAENPPPNVCKYVIAKMGLVGLTRSLAVEFSQHNIQVNMVVPGFVRTDLTKHVSKIFVENIRHSTAMKRIATPVDVAKAIIFLGSSLSHFTTGQKIMVTGGSPPFF